ncbi:hypothetical protein FKM82_007960 [Ascaphus truei]
MQSVQSVREMPATDTDFTFEIAMKNGKKKLLSAESADLRDVWMSFLWKSMQLPGPGRKNSSCTWYDIPDLVQRAQSASRDSVRENVNPERTARGDRVSESSLEPTQPSLPDVFHESDSKSDDAYDMPRPTPHEDTDVFRESDSEPDDVYDMPKPTPRDDTDSYQLCRESDDYDRSSEIYDVPRRYPSGVHPGENPYVPMDGLNLLDFSDPVNPVPGIVGDGASLGENANG